MYIHTSFLKEIIKTPDPRAKKERINALSFYYLFKSRYTNSIFYDYHTNFKSAAIKRYATELNMDHRTVKKYIDLLIKWGLAVKRGAHLQLVAMDKAFEYKVKENGKSDKWYRKKFIKVIIGKKWSIARIRSFVRVLLFKVVSNNKLLAEFYKRGEPFCKEVSKALFGVTRNLVPRRDKPGMTLMHKFGIKLIGKTIGVSKSTADRVVNDMVNARVIFKKNGGYKILGNVRDLKIPIDQVKNHYATFISKNGCSVIKKQCNLYAI